MEYLLTIYYALITEFTNSKNVLGWSVTSLSFMLSNESNRILTTILTGVSIIWVVTKIVLAILNYHNNRNK